jgi:DNA-binding winged helix-turn-helix (wHTH) protein/TolB-like protein
MTRSANQFYEFGPFRIDTAERLLLRDGVVVPLTPKVFDTLLALVQNGGHILTKDELLKLVWNDSVVEEASLTKNVSTLRKALGQTPDTDQYIETIPWRGYRFSAPVNCVEAPQAVVVEERTISRIVIQEDQDVVAAAMDSANLLPLARRHRDRRFYFSVAAVLLLAIAVVVWITLRRGNQSAGASTSITRKIAVLPFKSLSSEGTEDYLGLGIADTLIIRLSNIKEIKVRPTAAVRRYVNAESDPLVAGRELQVDSVLDGTFLKVGDHLRVSVNLLRVEDGASLWADKFDEQFTNIFEIQDRISQQVAARLRHRLDPVEQAQLVKRYASNPEAYSFYSKGIYHSSNIGPDPKSMPEAELAIDLLKKAIELDHDYAIAHAQLGYAYAQTAVFLEDNPLLIESANQELGIAERLDPDLAEVHAARYFIAFSQYGGWTIEKAIRELRLAQKLNSMVGHSELADLYAHIGLERQANEEFEIALEADPNNDRIKNGHINWFFMTARPDEGLELNKRFYSRGPDISYFLEKKMVNDAAPLVENAYQKEQGYTTSINRAILLALEGNHSQAQESIQAILKHSRRNRGYHHLTYIVARIYALGGLSEPAVKWLRVTVDEGFPCYPLFQRDSFLDGIRKDSAFVQFLAEMKTRWEYYQRELAPG